MKSKLFWAWVAVEVGAAMWFGWQIAKAEAKPWARKPKGNPIPTPQTTTRSYRELVTAAAPEAYRRRLRNTGAIF